MPDRGPDHSLYYPRVRLTPDRNVSDGRNTIEQGHCQQDCRPITDKSNIRSFCRGIEDKAGDKLWPMRLTKRPSLRPKADHGPLPLAAAPTIRPEADGGLTTN